jgi:hypothetical protein
VQRGKKIVQSNNAKVQTYFHTFHQSISGVFQRLGRRKHMPTHVLPHILVCPTVDLFRYTAAVLRACTDTVFGFFITTWYLRISSYVFDCFLQCLILCARIVDHLFSHDCRSVSDFRLLFYPDCFVSFSIFIPPTYTG